MTSLPSAVCARCNGEGAIRHRGEQALLGIFTLGIAPVLDLALSDGARDSIFARRCPTCRGAGWVCL